MVGLGEAEAADGFATRHRRQPALLLLLGAVGVDRVHRETALHRCHRPQAAVAALELLHDEAVGDVVHAGAAVPAQVGAEETELSHPGYQLAGELFAAVAALEERQALALDEAAHAVTRHALLVAEQRIELVVVDCGHERRMLLPRR